VYGIDNLFVAGSSVFPSGGYANPTLTLLALTLRLADHLKERQRSAGL
jgi:choline dehydrogenase-like flavoprotein